MADYDINAVLGIKEKDPTEAPTQEDKKPAPKTDKKKSPAKATKKTTVKVNAGDLVITKKETKSKRLQVLMKPSTYDKLKETADANGTTVNDLVNVIFETFLK